MKCGSIVDLLVSAGADLGGSDIEGGFVGVALSKAIQNGDEEAIHAWQKSGINLENRHTVSDENP